MPGSSFAVLLSHTPNIYKILFEIRLVSSLAQEMALSITPLVFSLVAEFWPAWALVAILVAIRSLSLVNLGTSSFNPVRFL